MQRRMQQKVRQSIYLPIKVQKDFTKNADFSYIQTVQGAQVCHNGFKSPQLIRDDIVLA